MKTALSFKNIRKTYESGTEALKGVSFDVNDGEFFGLLGPNGAGKTSLISILTGPAKQTSGSIEVYGKDINKAEQESKRMLGVVPQEIGFDPFFTVNEVLQFQSGYYGVKPDQKRIDTILEKLNLIGKKDARTRTLSGGMKRRLLIAKALVHGPKVLILDEPTAGVDVELRHTLWKYIRELNGDGLTILLTTHYLEEAEQLCNRVAIINEGELIKLDKTKVLTKSLGNQKELTATFKEKLDTIPESLKKFSAKKLNNHELHLTFEAEKTHHVLDALNKTNLCFKDIDIQGQSLEDVFIKLTNK